MVRPGGGALAAVARPVRGRGLGFLRAGIGIRDRGLLTTEKLCISYTHTVYVIH
jgi:hypothetical protein